MNMDEVDEVRAQAKMAIGKFFATSRASWQGEGEGAARQEGSPFRAFNLEGLLTAL